MLMFLKERTAPLLLERLPRLLHRLPKSHASYEDVVLDHYKVRAGFGGEQHVDGLLKRMRWHDPVMALAVFQLCDRFCQMDTVLLTSHGAVVLEVKNYSGTLSFDEQSYHMKQETRDGKFLGFNSPVTQVWNAREELLHLFEQLSISLPVYPVVVLPYSSTLIEGAPKEVPVIYGYSLNRFLSTLPRTERIMPPEELARLAQLLIDHHTPFPKKDFPAMYRYEVNSLVKGVLCSACGSRCERRSERVHACIRCEATVIDGYARALDDWFEFVSPEISNAECREFLGLKDHYAAKYVLVKMGLGRCGKGRAVRYFRE
ncbi:nuclease-related domain-containing protein [Planococcus sp. N064]|uniref:Nuclease-related domain-containing protein n=1 Tax=Planococcus liqunii TaxID=3058394 RepID=A0ABT8MNJ9_9BACL|nr:nuclease-related domain-containing protein [Planococcus sp. N064]MDN7226445.1 nuclease-related domain-containing protein [Planococcus sp. N064]